MSLLKSEAEISAPIIVPAFGSNSEIELQTFNKKIIFKRQVSKKDKTKDIENWKSLEDWIPRGSKEWYNLPIEKQAKLAGYEDVEKFKNAQIKNLHWTDQIIYKQQPSLIPSYLRNHPKLK
jgi:hypothetical protein